ncbi:MAG: hypothetical protein ABI210_10570 [Abditibacteriaceae bacterium]
MNTTAETYVGLLNFLTFGISIIAAVLAIDMYALLRTGQFAQTWRILIVASVLFVLLQVLRMSAILLDIQIASQLSQVVRLVFAIALAYAFYNQRKLYMCKSQHPQESEISDEDEMEDLDETTDEPISTVLEH